MKIRRYTNADDAALIALERQCPRGTPEPFVHYRPRFAGRACLFRSYFLLLIEIQGKIVAVAAAGVKDTQVEGKPLRLAYIFDVRVSPSVRRQGLASILLKAVQDELLEMECDGAYAHIVATNRASLTLFGRMGYQRRRQLRYLTYQPMPLFLDDPIPVIRHAAPSEQSASIYTAYDLFVDDVATSVVPYDFERWSSHDNQASISLYDQSLIFQQYPAYEPWPTPAEVSRRGGHWRLFHPEGDPKTLSSLFATIRDQAVSENINKLSMLVDVEEPMPSFFFAETSAQREYVVVTCALKASWNGFFGARFYSDSREL